ncbi:MAG: DUF1998 domain-containing protein [Polyangia bacterium]
MMLRLALALLGLVPAGLGLLLAVRLGRGKAGGGWARAAQAALPAGLAVLAVLLGLRALDYLGGGGGPAAWFPTAPGTSAAAGAAAGATRLALTALKLQLAGSVVFALGLLAGSRAAAAATVSRLAPLVGLVGALCALLATGVLAAAPLACEPVLDVAALAPVLGLGLAISGLGAAGGAARGPGATASPVPAAPPQPVAPPAAPAPASEDAEAILRRAGLLKIEPALSFAATDAARAGSAAAPTGPGRTALDVFWAGSGGVGAPPAVLSSVRQALQADGAARGQWLGDLPAETLDALLCGVVLTVLAGHGGRALLISPEPAALAAAVERALSRCGLSRPGAVAIGSSALKEQLAAGLFPVLVCLDVRELGGEVQKHLLQGNPLWLPLLDQVVLVRVDGLLPIESTHLALALRRLALLAGAQLGQGRGLRWLALSEGGPTGRRYLEQAVGRSFDELELGAWATTAARVFLRRLPAQPARTGPGAFEELLEWGRALRGGGLALDLEDTTGELGDAAQALGIAPQRQHRSAGYHGATSLALCDERHLAQLYRTGSRLVHRLPGGGQRSVVWLKDGPLTRFLGQPGTLAGLAGRGELPTPRPLAGTDNLILTSAHLEAALDEGQPDEAELRHAFSDTAVDALLQASHDVKRVGVRARWDAERHKLTRSALLSRPAAPLPEQRRQTITRSVVDVRSKHDGALLARVDRRLAPTRYYPHRVFADRDKGRLYQVLSASAGPDGGSILVGPAAAGSVPTTPLLALGVECLRYHAPPELHRFASVSFARAVAEIRVHESVTGAVPRGAAEPAVSYEPVEAGYDSTAAVLLFERVPSEAALYHLARTLDLLLPAHLVVEDEDIEVLALTGGLGELRRPALVFVDRHLGGLGVASALDAATAHNLLRWAWGVLYSCPCMNGCDKCSPQVVLKRGADKQGVLKLLGG